MDPSPDDLQRIVALLDQATVDEGFNLRPSLVRIEITDGDVDGFHLGLLDLDGQSVSEAVLGLRAEPTWAALGHMTGAWVAPPETWDELATERGRFGVRPSSHPDSVRARCIVLMARDGSIVGRVHTADGRVIDDPPSQGLALDGLRRVFGLPTAPATFPSAELLASLWLSDVIDAAEAARRNGRSLTTAAVLRLHPAIVLIEAGGRRIRLNRFAEAATALGRVLTWAEVRRRAQQGWFSSVVTPELATWMDEGMLARWLVGGFPPVAELVAEACRSLRPPVAGALRDALRSVGGLSAVA